VSRLVDGVPDSQAALVGEFAFTGQSDRRHPRRRIAHITHEMGVSRTRAYRWWARHGGAGLVRALCEQVGPAAYQVRSHHGEWEVTLYLAQPVRHTNGIVGRDPGQGPSEPVN
jgi:hypothetical protein